MTVRIVTDSTADLDAALARELGVSVVPLTIDLEGRSYRDSVDLDPADFYRRLPTADPPPRTSAPPPGTFTETFDHLTMSKDDRVVCITISGRLSGSLNAALAGKARATDPERVTILDSQAATAAEANIVVAAATAAARDETLEQVVAVAEATRDRQRLLVGLETLEYLQRGGRIGRARAFLGGLLSVKPILTLRDGEVAPAERVRSRARMIARLEDFALSYPDPEMISIVHAACRDEAEALTQRVRAAFPAARVCCGWIGPVVGLYTGPGAVGVAIVPRGSP